MKICLVTICRKCHVGYVLQLYESKISVIPCKMSIHKYSQLRLDTDTHTASMSGRQLATGEPEAVTVSAVFHQIL